jgi:hypothetical protein
VDFTLSPFLIYCEIIIPEGHALVQAPQSVHLAESPFIFKMEILEKFFKKIDAGQMYLQNALLSFSITASTIPAR